METASFDYHLRADAIAQRPAEPRDSSRLLVAGPPVGHRLTRDFPDLVGPGDVVVLNDTKVLAARVHLHKSTGGAVEVLVLEPVECGDGRDWWEAMVRPSRRVEPGTELVDHVGLPVLEVGPPTGQGTRLVRAVGVGMTTLLEHLGVVPLPPYIGAELDDPERYQTVYARHASSVAAPTAGLHLTDSVLDRCREAGATIETVELAVGMGTFRPVESERVEDHVMHGERYAVDAHAWDAIRRARRVVAVGTTVVRTLETVAVTGNLEGRTDLFIQPGFEFGVVDALLTNFHMPRSTLLVMLDAFMGPRWRELYDLALAGGYRFLSFGDAMFVERCEDPPQVRDRERSWEQ